MESLFFFFNDTATTEIYTLPLHDALPISRTASAFAVTAAGGYLPARHLVAIEEMESDFVAVAEDRKSTRLNSSHLVISYAVFCLKKKKTLRHKPHPLPWHLQVAIFIPQRR